MSEEEKDKMAKKNLKLKEQILKQLKIQNKQLGDVKHLIILSLDSDNKY